ncbi:MAG: MerR family transcriptional regulator [Pseudomonadota bacterium]|nr:MerR family transcriptional regulator [Pseudomonadota bacterium]
MSAIGTRFHIGRLARETGRSVHTIRWYEQQGLMPGVTRDAGGRRVYGLHHVSWLLFLDRLRYAGMPIREMRRYASLAAQGKKTIRQRLELLDAHHSRTVAHIAHLQAGLRLLEQKQAYYMKWLEDDRRPGDFVVPLPHQADGRTKQARTSQASQYLQMPRWLPGPDSNQRPTD